MLDLPTGILSIFCLHCAFTQKSPYEALLWHALLLYMYGIDWLRDMPYDFFFSFSFFNNDFLLLLVESVSIMYCMSVTELCVMHGILNRINMDGREQRKKVHPSKTSRSHSQ